ncbi:cysteine-rich venom protein 6 isoform X2 [Xylocopa sonorina]|uniref:cysteine-rich venom protein 6 isoform X2 n=1 Tax=Xylocopa sonorina TaxID=1818115 RepID=UPI00403AD816
MYIKAATVQISIRFKGTIQRTINRINMSRFILALLAILAIFSTSSMAGVEACPKNEVWNDCGTACPPSCENPNPICTMVSIEIQLKLPC